MGESIKSMTPKAKRLSRVALAGALMAVLWALVDQTAIKVDAVVVSAITGLIMLLAGYLDHKDPPTYSGEDQD
jgi:predicted histidine transporter YuiF (NhaC family)